MPKGWKKKHKSYQVSRRYQSELHGQDTVDPRYIRILDAIREYRLVRASDVQLLLGDSQATTYRLLQTLFHNRAIAKAWMDAPGTGRGGQRTAAHYLTPGGFQFLLNERKKYGLTTPFFAPINADMSQQFMRHTMGVTNTALHLQVAAEKLGWHIHESKNEWFFNVKNAHRLKNERAQDEKIALKVSVQTDQLHTHGLHRGKRRIEEFYLEPDFFMVIDLGGKKAPFFIEHDRNTESEEKWQRKVKAYNSLFSTGLFEHIFHWRGFRVLTTVAAKDKAARVNTLLQYTEALPEVGGKFYFIHEDDLDTDTLLTKAVWSRALSEGFKSRGLSKNAHLFSPSRLTPLEQS